MATGWPTSESEKEMRLRFAINSEDMREQPDGCQSTSHTHRECWGELRECSRCHRKVCYADGTTNDPDLCDACWSTRKIFIEHDDRPEDFIQPESRPFGSHYEYVEGCRS